MIDVNKHHLFYINPADISISTKSAILKDDEFKHASKTFRLNINDKINFFDGSGNFYHASIGGVSRNSFNLEIIEIECIDINYRLSVYVGLPKGKKMDFIVKALTECGATKICTFTSEYTIAKAVKTKVERFRDIAIQACKQSKRAYIPELIEAISFDDLLRNVKVASTAVVFYEKEKEPAGMSVYKDKDITLVVGSEGGFSSQEIERFKENSAIISSLGDAVLRVETAAISATSLVRYAQFLCG